MLKPLILASQSPRRTQLLTQLGISHTVLVCSPEDAFVEEQQNNESPEDYVVRNCLQKPLHTISKFPNETKNCFVLGSDTIVINKNNKVLEKPQDVDDAISMLLSLSGSWHTVLTGFAIVDAVTLSTLHVERVPSRVLFRELSRQEIESYVESGEPLDKAGAYGIQGTGAGFVEQIQGSYTAIMGLPGAQVVLALRKVNILTQDKLS